MRIEIRRPLSCLYLLLLLLAGPSWGDDVVRFYYFDPDSPQHNLERLKIDMESLLEKTGLNIEFQPFAHVTDFNRSVKKNRPSFVFAPGWYFRSYGNQLRLRPLLRSVRGTRTSYRKLLITSRLTQTEKSAASRASLAMTSLGPESKIILNRILGGQNKLGIARFNIVEVPKDADAVFAAALRQVDFALVSESTFQQIKEINPKLIDSLTVVGESKPLAMPILGFIKDVASTDQRKIFKDFMISTQNSPAMRTLRIDGWSVPNE